MAFDALKRAADVGLSNLWIEIDLLDDGIKLALRFLFKFWVTGLGGNLEVLLGKDIGGLEAKWSIFV